jgi:hypothetical protein
MNLHEVDLLENLYLGSNPVFVSMNCCDEYDVFTDRRLAVLATGENKY